MCSSTEVDLRSILNQDIERVQEGPAYTEAFLTVLRQVSKEEVVQYILALLDDMVTGETLLQTWLQGRQEGGCLCLALYRAEGMDQHMYGIITCCAVTWQGLSAGIGMNPSTYKPANAPRACCYGFRSDAHSTKHPSQGVCRLG